MGTYDYLRNLQNKLANRVRLCPLEKTPETAGGVDVSVDAKAGMCHAAIVVVDRSGAILDTAAASRPLTFPYVPGLLSFREMPVIFLAMQMLRRRPDVFILDGQGISHPRRIGIAAHFGVVFNVAAIGCAKSRLVGEHDDVGTEKGSTAVLTDHGERIGTVVRTRSNVKPVFVSPGHRVSHDDAVAVTLAFTTRYRLPEPTRQAHIASNRQRTGQP